VRAVSGIYGAIGKIIDFQVGGVFEQVHAVCCWIVHAPADPGGQCAFPAADLQHALPIFARMGGNFILLPGACDCRRDYQGISAMEGWEEKVIGGIR